MKILKVYPVKGKDGRKENLFGVYVLKKLRNSEKMEGEKEIIAEPISVRTECGKWTLKYAELLEAMSIPAYWQAGN